MSETQQMVPDHKDVLFVVHFDCRPAVLRLALSTRISREAIMAMVIIIYMQRYMKNAEVWSAHRG